MAHSSARSSSRSQTNATALSSGMTERSECRASRSYASVAAKASIRVLKNRNQIWPQVLGLFPQRLGHDDPIERNPPVTQQRPQLDRVRRRRGSDQPIASIIHARYPDDQARPLRLRSTSATCFLPNPGLDLTQPVSTFAEGGGTPASSAFYEGGPSSR